MTEFLHQNQSIACLAPGAMGGPILDRLLQKHFDLIVYDPNPKAAYRDGVTLADTLAEAIAQASLILLPDATVEHIETLLLSPAGALASPGASRTVMLCSALPPDAVQYCAQSLQEEGVELLDVAILGGANEVMNGAPTLMVSGPESAYLACETVLASLASEVYRVGEAPGQGTAVKLLSQLLSGIHLTAVAEVLALASRIGVEAQPVYDILAARTGLSREFTTRVFQLMTEAGSPGSILDALLTDLGLALDVGKQARYPLPMSSMAHQVLLMGVTAGFGRDAAQAATLVAERLSALQLPEPSISQSVEDG